MPPRRHPSLPPLVPAHAMTSTGKVKFYDPKRGYGFISQADGPDVFVHAKIIQRYGLQPEQMEADVPVRFLPIDVGGRRPEVTAIAIV
jgi:CspA family cold shock protein